MAQQHSRYQQDSRHSTDFLAHLSEPGLGGWAGLAFAAFSIFWAIALTFHQVSFLAQEEQYWANRDAVPISPELPLNATTK